MRTIGVLFLAMGAYAYWDRNLLISIILAGLAILAGIEKILEDNEKNQEERLKRELSILRTKSEIRRLRDRLSDE